MLKWCGTSDGCCAKKTYSRSFEAEGTPFGELQPDDDNETIEALIKSPARNGADDEAGPGALQAKKAHFALPLREEEKVNEDWSTTLDSRIDAAASTSAAPQEEASCDDSKAQGTELAPILAKRKSRQILTFIPEQERSIDYRFQIIIAGPRARQFAERICSADASQAFKPKQQKSTENFEDDNLCFFCTLGAMQEQLVRLRFVVVEGFSNSMPAITDQSVSRDTCVLFLHWNDPESKEADAAPSGAQECLEASMDEFRMRVAEVNFHMKFLPLICVLCLCGTSEQETGLRTFVESCKLKHNAEARLLSIENDDEDSLVHFMRKVCELVILEFVEEKYLAEELASGKKACCALM